MAIIKQETSIEERTVRARAETRKQQIARRLKVSERVLEQYFQSKQAEVIDEQELTVVPERKERAEVRRAEVRRAEVREKRV